MEIHNIESFLSYFQGVRSRTLRVVGAVPAGKLEWRHSAGVFSPGDLARHIAATERFTFAENVLEPMRQETILILEGLTAADLPSKRFRGM